MWVKRLRAAAYTAITLYVIAFAARSYLRQYETFLPDYFFRWSLSGPAGLVRPRPTHVFLLIADHFEPDSVSLLDEWRRRYAALAARHHDSAGRAPQHTWFYPAEQMWEPALRAMAAMAAAGLGEVELHHHHSFDTGRCAIDVGQPS